MCWQIKTGHESGKVSADLTTTVVHSYKSLKNDDKHVHSLTPQALVTILDYI